MVWDQQRARIILQCRDIRRAYNGIHWRICRANPDKLEARIEVCAYISEISRKCWSILQVQVRTSIRSSSSTYYITRHQSIKNYGSLTTALTICKKPYTITSNLLSKLLVKEASFRGNCRYILSLASFYLILFV